MVSIVKYNSINYKKKKLKTTINKEKYIKYHSYVTYIKKMCFNIQMSLIENKFLIMYN